jgi:hypothetical protein
MKVVTNGTFAVAVIPECRATSVMDWGQLNDLQVLDTESTNLDYYIPYRNSYDRILRGLGADFHELMFDQQIVNLNESLWDDVETAAINFINNWIETGAIPVPKKFCHSGYYRAYINSKITGTFFEVSDIVNLPTVINQKYNLNLSSDIPDLPPNFYKHTVPYWVIDSLYKSNTKLKILIDQFCERDKVYTPVITQLNKI